MSYFLSRRIASAEQNLDGVQNSITALSTSTTTLSGNVLTLEQDLILTEDSLLASLGLQSTQLNAKINAVNANVSSLQSNVSGTNASINSNITILQGNVSTLSSNIGTLQTNIASINGNVSSATSNIALLQGNVSTLTSNITALQSSVAGISSINDSQALMLVNQGLYIGVLDTNQSAISGNVSILQGNISSINANYTVKSLTAGTNITTVNSNGNWTISAPSLSVPSYLVCNELVSSTPSIDGYTTNGWSPTSTITWDFDNFEYDIQFDLQIGAGGYYPVNIFWSWDGILSASNQYHHSWIDHDGINLPAGYFGAGQDIDNRLIYTYAIPNTHHNFNMTLKRVRCPHVSYNQRLFLECNCNQIIVSGGTANISSARMPFSRTNNYHFSTSTTASVFNGSKALVFYGKLSNCASTSNSGNYAWLKIRKIPIS